MKQSRIRNQHDFCLIKKDAITCIISLLLISLQAPSATEARIIVKSSTNFEVNYNDYDDMGSPVGVPVPSSESGLNRKDPDLRPAGIGGTRTRNKPGQESNARAVGIELNQKSNKEQSEMTVQEIQEYFTKYQSSDKGLMTGRAGLPGRSLECDGNKRWSNVLKKCLAVRGSGNYGASRGSASASQNLRHRNKKYKTRTVTAN